ncbi:Mitochondrial protein mmf1 [Lachnellula arida]|uniref:Mitochondrial protein mmf1 n=1 Tax=Lachnellula arida TaxID=1316785 RepID=A0A8T9BMN4_9HELO|nr:Mitochondrial protein mmf1 [Lachnellula arida]
MATPILSKNSTARQIHADISGNLIEGTISEQTAVCLKNLVAVLIAGGSSLEEVFKVIIFQADMSYFAEMNAQWFVWEGKMPARSYIAVKQLPKGARVKIQAVAQG